MNTQHRNRIMNPAAPVLRFASTRHACGMLLIALTSSLANAQGPLVAWGDDSGGIVSGAPSGSFVAVAAGAFNAYHAVGIRTNGTLASWGDPVMVAGTPAGTFVAVATSGWHALAIRSDGTLAAWGQSGLEGQEPAGTFTAVATSGWHSVAIRSDGTLAAWGNDLDFRWGSNGQVSGPNSDGGTFIAVACTSDGGGNTRAIRADGTLAAWGGDWGTPWPDSPSGSFSAISPNDYYYAAIRTNGSLVEWTGLNGGALDALETTGPFVALATVAAPVSHQQRYGITIAIRADGTLVGLGPDSFELVSGIPAGTYSAVAAAGGSYPFTGGFFCVAIATPTGNQPPVITCNAPVVLWSPDHELVDVSSAISVSDPDGNPVTLTCRVFSDETEIPDTGDGTGRHAPDFKNELTEGRGLLVRSERRGAEDGRFYILVVTANDGLGGVTTATCIAAVCPRDQTQQSLNDVLAQAEAAAATVQSAVDLGTLPPTPGAPSGLCEHGLSAPLGPNQ